LGRAQQMYDRYDYSMCGVIGLMFQGQESAQNCVILAIRTELGQTVDRLKYEELS